MNGDTLLYELPALKEGVIAVSEVDKLSSEDAHSTNLYYARNYTTWAEAASLVRIYFGTVSYTHLTLPTTPYV